MQWLTIELGLNGGDDLWVTMADIENAEAAQTIDVLFAGYVAIAIRPRVRPFDRGCGVFDRCRFPVFQKSWIDVVAEIFYGFIGDP
jgi:hypothetical protein